MVESIVFRTRWEGLPLLMLKEDMDRLMEALLTKVLDDDFQPKKWTVVTDPITERPAGRAYVDFSERNQALEVVRRRMRCRLGQRRINIIHEGARTELVEEEMPASDDGSFGGSDDEQVSVPMCAKPIA